MAFRIVQLSEGSWVLCLEAKKLAMKIQETVDAVDEICAGLRNGQADKIGGLAVEAGVGCEDRATTLSLITNNATHDAWLSTLCFLGPQN